MATLKLKHSPALVTLQRPTHPAFTAAMWQQSRRARAQIVFVTAASVAGYATVGCAASTEFSCTTELIGVQSARLFMGIIPQQETQNG